MAWQWVSALLVHHRWILLWLVVLFLPKYDEYAVDGMWLFVAASILSLGVGA
jgi:hypothetical protein